MESLRKKLGVLREAQRGLQDDIRANAQLGEEVRRDAVLSFTHPLILSPAGFYLGCLKRKVTTSCRCPVSVDAQRCKD